jgi:hypothetical protein
VSRILQHVLANALAFARHRKSIYLSLSVILFIILSFFLLVSLPSYILISFCGLKSLTSSCLLKSYDPSSLLPFSLPPPQDNFFSQFCLTV